MSDRPTEPTPKRERTSAHETAAPRDTNVADKTSADATPAEPKPRVRSGAIAWGLIVCATAVLVLSIVCVPANADAFDSWTASLTPPVIVIIGVIALGAFILLMAVLSLIRRAQRRHAIAR